MRLPAHCAGCGTRVELSIGESVQRPMPDWRGTTRNYVEFKLPTQWVDPGTAERHRCAR